MTKITKKIMTKIISMSLMLMLSVVTLTGCETDPKCTEVRNYMENEGYLDGWTYVKDIESLDDTPNPSGRYLFALYENDEEDGQYAVLEVLACTDGSFSADLTEVNYNASTDTAKSIDKSARIVSEEFIFDGSKPVQR